MDDLPLRRQGLFLCEAEIARRLGLSERRWRQVRETLEAQGMPAIDPLLGGRCWPAVEAWFVGRYKSGNMIAPRPDGEEKW